MAAGSTYTPIATNTLGTAAASVTFSSISGSYTDLVLVVSGQFTATGNQYVAVQVGNGSVDTGTNYSDTQLIGTGTSAISGRDSNTDAVLLATFASTSSSIGTAIFNLMNYSNTTTYKTILGRGSDTNGWSIAGVGLWRSTSAINTIKVYVTGTTFVTGSTFTLYGIQSA